MSEDRIKDKDCYQKLASIKRADQWVRATEKLGFRIANGGKHPFTVRDPQNTDDSSAKNLVTTIPSGIHRIMNQKIAKEILFSPISARLKITEDMLWKALGFK